MVFQKGATEEIRREKKQDCCKSFKKEARAVSCCSSSWSFGWQWQSRI